MSKWVIGNLKMNKTNDELREYSVKLKKLVKKWNVKIAVCPSFVGIGETAKVLKRTQILVGAQNIATEGSGAYTGEVSAEMLTNAGAKVVLIGHSERRRYYAETDDIVNKKLIMAQKENLIPVVCLVYDGNEGYQIDLEKQLENVLRGVDVTKPIIFALEPVWAIGTGKTMSCEDIEPAIEVTKTYAKHLLGYEPEVLYGGSVNSLSAVSLLEMKNCDGFLVGTACKDAYEFAKLCEMTANK